MDDKRQARKKHFAEEVGIVFDQTGLPPMAGRIFGWLLISDPPHQSINELAEALMASKGSISTMTRLLMQTGLIERFSLPGVRHDYFRLHHDAWRHMIKRGVEDEIKMIHQIAERGLELISDKKHPNQKWLEEMHIMYASLEREFPALLERFEKEGMEALK